MSDWLMVFSGMLAALVVDRALSVVSASVAVWRFKRMLTQKTQPDGWPTVSAAQDRWVESAKRKERAN